MTFKQKLIAILFSLIALLGGGTATALNLGGNDSFGPFTRSTRVFIGPTPTKVATSSPNRTFLEISNISNATSTAGSAIFCSTSLERDTYVQGAATAYSGITIFASSTKRFTRNEGMPTQAIYCINPAATTSVTVVES